MEKRISDLERWKEERIAQQITYPLDYRSLAVLGKYFLSQTAEIEFVGASGNSSRIILIQQDGKTNGIYTYPSLITYTANTTTDTLSIGQDLVNLNQGSFSDGQQVLIQTTDTSPAPLSDAAPYYVVNSSLGGTRIQVSATFGGAAINLTTTGTGQQFIYFVT